MIKQTELKQLKTGDDLNHFFILNKLEVKLTKTNKEYLNLELRDKSASVPAKVWDNVENIKNKIKEGDLVKVAGVMEEFNSQPQIKMVKIHPVKEEDNVTHADFLPVSKRDFNEMKKEFENRVSKISNSFLNQIVKNIFTESNFAKYSKAPAGKAWHHSYVHGLLEHTLEIIKICDLMCDIHHELNRDLLISGAMLHDFGKTEELQFDSTFDYTDKGKLLGHIVIAALEIEKAALKIPNFPDDLKNQLIHLVLSHQGKLEYASPVEPKTLEAIVLYHADELSAKTNAYKSAIQNDEQTGGSWTRYLPLAGTSLFIPPDDSQNDKPKETLFD